MSAKSAQPESLVKYETAILVSSGYQQNKSGKKNGKSLGPLDKLG